MTTYQRVTRRAPVTTAPRLHPHERARYRAAAGHARRIYPGPLGELVHRELSAYAEFGHRFTDDGLISRLAAAVLVSSADTRAAPMTPEEIEKHTRRAIECWNRRDWTSYRRLADPGFTYSETGTGRRVKGTAPLLPGWQRMVTAFPDAAAEICQICVAGAAGTALVIWRATQTWPLPTGDDPSDKHVQVWDLIAMRWAEGRLLEERHQLGILSLLDTANFPPVTGSVCTPEPEWTR